MAPPISRRGEKLIINPPKSEYIRRHYELVGDEWDPVTNPDGYIALAIAENKIVWDLLEPRMASCRELEHYSLGYDSMIGSPRFRDEVARFLSRTFIGRKVLPDQLAILNGAGSVLETLFYVLCDPDDGVLVPTPSYMGFWAFLQTRDELNVVTVDCSSEDGFALTRDRLDAAVATSPYPIKVLLYTNPNNPLGRVYSAAEVEDVLQWAEENEIHVVLDEIYALSVFGDTEFTSGAYLRPEMGDWLHIVWAFSKDFGMSGLRTGVLFTENETVHRAVEAVSFFSAVSGDTQSMLGQLLADEEWVDAYLAENRRRLGDAYRRVTSVLDQYGIIYLPADSGFFFLIDVRPLMGEITWEEEARLWNQLVDELNINLTPGSGCYNAEPGFMRFVFSSVPTEAAIAGAHRLGRFAAALAQSAVG